MSRVIGAPVVVVQLGAETPAAMSRSCEGDDWAANPHGIYIAVRERDSGGRIRPPEIRAIWVAAARLLVSLWTGRRRAAKRDRRGGRGLAPT